jgi:hypothetical protein
MAAPDMANILYLADVSLIGGNVPVEGDTCGAIHEPIHDNL